MTRVGCRRGSVDDTGEEYSSPEMGRRQAAIAERSSGNSADRTTSFNSPQFRRANGRSPDTGRFAVADSPGMQRAGSRLVSESPKWAPAPKQRRHSVSSAGSVCRFVEWSDTGNGRLIVTEAPRARATRQPRPALATPAPPS